MVKFKHKLTGTIMHVPEERKEEYLTAGHELVVDTPKETKKKKTKKEV